MCVKLKCFQVSLQRLAPDWVLTLVLETSLATKPSGLVLNLEMGPETGTLRLGAGAWSLDWRMEMVCYALHPSTYSGFIG